MHIPTDGKKSAKERLSDLLIYRAPDARTDGSACTLISYTAMIAGFNFLIDRKYPHRKLVWATIGKIGPRGQAALGGKQVPGGDPSASFFKPNQAGRNEIQQPIR